jgi:hypothetical protein
VLLFIDAMTELPSIKFALDVPSEEELVSVIREGIRNNFAESNVELVDSSQVNFSDQPWNLSAPGLRGSPGLCQVGGHHNLIYPSRRDIHFNINDIAKYLNLKL